MTLHPLMPVWLIALVFGGLLVACLVALVTKRGRALDWLRRFAIVAVLLVIALRPVTMDETTSTKRMNANVIFVVDLTGSMAAEDYQGGKTRLDGAKSDIKEIMQLTKGSRYSIIAFDSTATSQLPLTTDAGAVESWIDTASVERTDYSKGSNVDRPRQRLHTLISETRKEDPKSHVFVYMLTDGENTDGKDSQPFTGMASGIDAGAVLGYGTEAGGPMKVTGGKKDGQYIQDPSGGKGLSKYDPKTLASIAKDLQIEHLHRTEPGGLEPTLQGIKLEPIKAEEEQLTPRFDDWYWIPAIALAALAIWELLAMIYRIARPLERADIAALAGGHEEQGRRR